VIQMNTLALSQRRDKPQYDKTTLQ